MLQLYALSHSLTLTHSRTLTDCLLWVWVHTVQYLGGSLTLSVSTPRQCEVLYPSHSALRLEDGSSQTLPSFHILCSCTV